MSAVIAPIDVSEFNGDGLKIIGKDGFDILVGTQLDDLYNLSSTRIMMNANLSRFLMIFQYF